MLKQPPLFSFCRAWFYFSAYLPSVAEKHRFLFVPDRFPRTAGPVSFPSNNPTINENQQPIKQRTWCGVGRPSQFINEANQYRKQLTNRPRRREAWQLYFAETHRQTHTHAHTQTLGRTIWTGSSACSIPLASTRLHFRAEALAVSDVMQSKSAKFALDPPRKQSVFERRRRVWDQTPTCGPWGK